jgi:2-(1,2-epoxy-1,2-dihydrophenyl)acetyl-CoA isomerase
MDGATAPAKVKTEVRDRIGIITLNDPATLNAAGLDLMADLHGAFEVMVADPGVRAIGLPGEGRGFCSGANLSAGGAGAPSVSDPNGPNQSLLKVYNPFVSAVRKSPKPLIAAVNGVAAGVGATLAMVCDLSVAGESAYFLQAFRRIGLVPDGGATYMLPRLVGKARAMELTLLGEKLPAKTALEWGMINRCVPDAELMSTAMELAKALADGPASLGYTRNLIWASLDSAWHEQVEEEAYAQGNASRTEDAREGIMAFVQKSPTDFKGK